MIVVFQSLHRKCRFFEYVLVMNIIFGMPGVNCAVD